METIPWDRSLLYLLVPYKVRREYHEDTLILKSLTMTDLATEWFEIIKHKDKQVATTENPGWKNMVI